MKAEYARLAQRDRAERSLQFQIVQGRTAASSFDEAFSDSLTESSQRLVGLLLEFPYLCETVGVSAAAECLGHPTDFVALLRGLENLPHWASATLLSLESALAHLRSSSRDSLGAIEQWRRELDAGMNGQVLNRPSTWILDPLWEAACYEAASREAERDGLLDLSDALIAKAADSLTRKAA